MKRLLGLLFVCAALIIVGCGEDVIPEAPVVEYTVTSTGATLRLTWDDVADADGYYIYADDAIIDTIDEATTTTYDATTPAAVYAVSAYAGEEESDLTEVDCAPVITLSIDVYGNTDPDTLHPSGFGFNTAGTAVAYSLRNTANHPLIDYYINSTVSPMEFWSPHHHDPPYNNEVNVTKNSGSTTFDDLDIADAPGGYTSQTDIVSSAVYYFWIDPTDNGWDNATDYFGKIKVEAIDGLKVTMKFAFQPIAGLRWCVTD